MAKNAKLTGVLLDPQQRQKVERWAALAGVDMSTVIRTLIDGVEVEIRPHIVVSQPPEQPTVVMQRT